jgi:hypothetical protein
MTTTMKSQHHNAACRVRWFPSRHGGACANGPRRQPSPCRSPPFDAGARLNDAPMIRAQVNDRRNQSRYPHPKSPRAALKSP